MNTEGAGEARLEVALAQAIINEVKYGSETSQLAEVSLLAAFQNRMVGGKLVRALLLLMPGLKYLSIGALLKDGVVVRTSNLAVEGPVVIRPQSLRGSAARVAARKNTTFHTKKRSEDETGLKYYELQEAWESAKATSVLTVPIPAVRTYASASIADTPPLEETASDPASHVCPVLHNLNGAVGVVTLGLATEDIDLEGRQGKAFQGIAQSLSPFLAYYATPVLKQLNDQIRAVANSNAASVAKFKARHHHDASQAQPSLKRHSTDGSERSHAGENAISPFSTAPYPPAAKRRSGDAADLPAQSSPHKSEAAAAQACTVATAQQSPNPFAQVATVSFSERCPDDTEQHSQSQLQAPVRSAPQQQPVSPFAAAAQSSGRLFDAHAKAAAQLLEHDMPSQQQSGIQQHQVHSSEPGSHAMTDLASQEEASSAAPQSDLNDASSSEEVAVAPGRRGETEEEDGSALDACFVFKRRPILSSHVRRYSTSTFFQGVLYTPRDHFSHVSNMTQLHEETSGEVQQQAVTVDDFSYASLTQQINRRALSTPQGCASDGPLSPNDFHQQMHAHASCPGPLLFEVPFSNGSLLDAEAQASAIHTHIALQGQFSKDGLQQGVMFGRAPTFSTAAAASDTTRQAAGSTHLGPSRLSKQIKATGSADSDLLTASVENPVFDGLTSSDQSNATQTSSEDCNMVKPSKPALYQHPFWLTFSEPQMEEKFNLWFGHKCSKVDTIFMLAATIYITQLLFFTWALTEQQSAKWPLFGYIMLPVLMLQHGDAAWYLKNRCTILAGMRVLLLGFLALVGPSIVQHHPGASTKWMNMSGLGPLVLVPLGLLVRFKLHVVLHAISCASVVLQGIQMCTAEASGASGACHMASLQRLAVATCAPSFLLYLIELRARTVYLQMAKV